MRMNTGIHEEQVFCKRRLIFIDNFKRPTNLYCVNEKVESEINPRRSLLHWISQQHMPLFLP